MGTIQLKDYTPGTDLDDNDNFYAERSGAEVKVPWQLIRTLLGGSSGGSGVFSYIDSATFESGLTGWATYADAAGATPVDGAGGTPTSPEPAINTTNPLDQTKDLTWAKPASNVQGEGISVAFSLPRSSLGREQLIAFPYLVDVDSVLGVYIRDETNGVLIPTSMVNLNKSYNSIPNFFFAKWMPSSSTSYRFIIHVQTTTTSAVNLEIDDVVVNVYSQVVANAIEMEKTYTPSFTNFGTVTNINVSVARRGNKAKFNGRFTTGTVGAGEARIGLPNSWLIDSSFITTLQKCGTLDRTTANAGAYSILCEPNVGYVTLGVQASGSGGLAKINGNAFGNSEVLSFEFEVPIAGLGVNANLASDFVEYAYNSSATDADDTSSYVNGPSAIVGATGPIRTTTLTAMRKKRCVWLRAMQPNDEITLEIWDGYAWFEVDYAGVFSTGGGTRSIPFLSAAAAMASNTIVGMGLISVNSTTVDVIFGKYAVSDYASNSSEWSSTNFLTGTKWRLKKKSSGNMAEVPPLVYALYRGAVATVVNGTVKFPTKLQDTHNAFNTSTGLFTAPIKGFYKVGIAGLNNGSTINPYVQVNGADPDGQKLYFNQATGSTQSTGEVPVYCNAGDTIGILTDNGTGSTQAYARGYFIRIGQ